MFIRCTGKVRQENKLPLHASDIPNIEDARKALEARKKEDEKAAGG
jgi:hypothetical protein